jgi:hypothetical protein
VAEQQCSNAILLHYDPGALPTPHEAVKEGSMVMCHVTACASNTNSSVEALRRLWLAGCSRHGGGQTETNLEAAKAIFLK